MVHKGKRAYLKKENATGSSDGTRAPKKARIIVRNLPFKNLSEKTVEELFQEYGDIEEVKLLKKDEKTFVGCGFVQFKTVTSAAKAIRHANEKEVLGRKIVVDWALPKKTFIEKIKKLDESVVQNEIKEEVPSDEEKPVFDFSIDKTPEKLNGDEDSESNGEDEEENDNESADESGDEGMSDDDDDDFEDETSGSEKSSKSDVEQKKQTSTDVEEGKTVFVRNIPFSATNEDLKTCMQNYGDIIYALICIDKLTEHSKGTGFVKFKEKESASQCIKDSTKIFLHDNPLTVTMALTKESLESRKTSKKVVKDSRNLYLIREGVVVAGSKAAEGVSAGDMAKRLQLEQWKNQILKNLNMFVSRTRLVIHNLPPSYDDSKLRELFIKHSPAKAVIREAKVMYDKKKFDASGKPLSKEVGFVSYTNHEDALYALRSVNNNPNIFSIKKRPIVAFSIENKAVINSKVKRIEKSRAKLGVTIEGSDKLLKLNRKQRRFLRRREKFIQRRKEKKSNLSNESPEEVKAEKEEKTARKRKSSTGDVPKKKQKTSNPKEVDEESKNPFTGVISQAGKKVKLRSKFRLKNQANIHSQTLKKERRQRREKQRQKMTRMKLPKEKKGRPKLMDDANLSKLLKKHRESVQESSITKKWYDK